MIVICVNPEPEGSLPEDAMSSNIVNNNDLQSMTRTIQEGAQYIFWKIMKVFISDFTKKNLSSITRSFEQLLY